MTENEAKETREWLQDFIRTFGCNFDDLETRGFNECVMFLKELEQYRAIGTVEEFKDLKEKEERFDRNIKMFNEIGLKIRAKAIDEFAEALKLYKHGRINGIFIDVPLYKLEEIAEQLKAGGIDG